ncbi:MAG: hypothetical protein L7S56_03685 [Candidatus Poseidonia sp.]|nr:hypothetical protein [Poseidonia sp.]
MVDHAEMRAWLESTKQRGMSLGLTNTARALNALGMKKKRPFTVHVAGSNGKGTCCAALTAALSLRGISNLLFSSPHLIQVEERIRVNGESIASSLFDEALERVHKIDEGGELTFFEVTFLTAMILANQIGVEVLVLETGLGGRLDATRTVAADVCLITSLSLEHTDVLGATLPEIAKEKAAIARPNSPLIVRKPENAEVMRVIETVALNAGNEALGEEKGSAHVEIVAIPEDATYHAEAIVLAEAVWKRLSMISDTTFPRMSGVNWPARMQRWSSPSGHAPTYLLDGAHNPSGMERSMSEICRLPAVISGAWVLLFGTSPQVNLAAMLRPLLAACNEFPPQCIVLSEPQGGRYPAVPVGELFNEFDSSIPTHLYPQPAMAVEYLMKQFSTDTCVVSIGSLYMQGNVLQSLNQFIQQNDDAKQSNKKGD